MAFHFMASFTFFYHSVGLHHSCQRSVLPPMHHLTLLQIVDLRSVCSQILTRCFTPSLVKTLAPSLVQAWNVHAVHCKPGAATRTFGKVGAQTTTIWQYTRLGFLQAMLPAHSAASVCLGAVPPLLSNTAATVARIINPNPNAALVEVSIRQGQHTPVEGAQSVHGLRGAFPRSLKPACDCLIFTTFPARNH